MDVCIYGFIILCMCICMYVCWMDGYMYTHMDVSRYECIKEFVYVGKNI